MTKKLRILIAGLMTLVVIGLIILFPQTEQSKEVLTSIDEQKAQHEAYLQNSPYTETLKWDKKKRKLNGLPPNRYFEQMWEMTINPSTGQLEDGQLTVLREQIIAQRAASRNPGDASNAWVERGPNNVGGRTRVIMFDPNDASNNTVYAGGVSGGLWKNTNIGNASSTWARIDNVPGNLSVTSITVDPRDSNTWYVGTGEQYTAGDVVGNGVYVTTDGGNNWSALTIPAADNGDINFSATNLFLSGLYYVNDVLAWDNGNSTELFVGVGANAYGASSGPTNWLGLQSAGIYRSTDGGSNWNRIESSNLQHTFSGQTYHYIPNDFEVGADNKIWVGTIGSALGEGGGRVFSSTNGSTFTEAAASPLADSNRVELEPSATNGNKLYALTQGSGSTPVHVYQTTNAFGTISSKSLPNDADTGIAANDFCRGQAFYDLVIEADPANDNIFYIGGIDLFKTTNGGNSYSQLSHWYGGFGFQPVHADQHSIAFGNNSSSRLLFGNDGGVYYTSNSGTNINVRNNGYNVTQFVKAGIGPDGTGDTNGVFSAGAQDNGTQAFRNAVAGVNPSEELSDGDGFYTFVDKDGDYMIATYTNNVIYRFNLPWNGQGRINGAATSLADSRTTGDFVNQMGYDDDANRLLSNNSSGTNYSIRSINVNNTSSGTFTNTALNSKPTAFRASPFTANVWYVGTANGGLLRLTNVTNSSANFTALTTPFVGSVSSVRLGDTANDIIVTIHNYGVTSIWYSSNGGTSWVSKEGNLPNIPVRDFLLNPLSPNEAIVATQLGVWQTSDFNTSNPSWSQSYNGMSDVSVTSLDYWDVSGDDTNNKVIASTYGRGVFTGKFTTTSAPDTVSPTAPTNLTSSNVTETSVDLSWTAATDNVGVSGYDVYQGSSIIASVTNTNYQAGGLTANTNYDYSIRAKDAAGNESVASNTESITTLTANSSNGCSSGISSFPYSEGFENTLGAWTQDTGDDINWTIDANGTTSNGTGPSSASQGNFYVYVEASGNGTGFPTKQAILNSPCFDLSSLSNATFSFKYHQFGSANMGSIDLEASIDNGANWSSIWNSTGNKGNSWLSQNIDLSGYTGGGVQLRFNRITGSTWEADIAIDDVILSSGGVSENTGCTGGITAFPYTEGFENTLGGWTQSTTDDLNWTVDANGTPSNRTGPSSAIQGSYYIFVEASGNNTGFPTKQAIINSPCYDLTSQTTATFSFNYHQYGSADMGRIDLEVSDDNGASWLSIWTSTGNKGNSWLSQNVDLSGYAGGGVQLRFNRITGGTWEADIAIDNISLSTASSPVVKDETVFINQTETFNINDIKIYPNPIKEGYLNISSSSPYQEMAYEIYNSIGQVVGKGELKDNRINIDELDSGVYFIQFSSEGESLIKRFIKS